MESAEEGGRAGAVYFRGFLCFMVALGVWMGQTAEAPAVHIFLALKQESRFTAGLVYSGVPTGIMHGTSSWN